MSKPIIYLSGQTTIKEGKPTISVSTQKMLDLLVSKGAEVVIVRHGENQDLSKADAFMLMGNDYDIDPARYKAEQDPRTKNEMQKNGRSDADFALAVLRANKEYEIIDFATKHGSVMFGICGGHQRINVAYDGTLIQHVDGQMQTAPMATEVEGIKLVPDTNFARTASPNKSTMVPKADESGILINSYHHQTIGEVGKGLRVAAISQHGTIEALESLDGKITTVQWHPEFMPNNNLTNLLLDDFLAKAKEHAAAKEVSPPVKAEAPVLETSATALVPQLAPSARVLQ